MKRKYSKAFRAVAGTAVRYGVKRLKAYAASKSRKQYGGADGGITTQHDSKLQYRYRRQPRWKRRRWVKAIRRNDAMDMSKQATRVAVMNGVQTDEVTYDASAGRYQTAACCGLYTVRTDTTAHPQDTTDIGFGDIARVVGADSNLNGYASKFCFTSAVLDMTLTATGGVSLEVDMYYIKVLRNPKIAESVCSTLSNFFQFTGVNAQTLPTGGGTLPAIYQRGTTLFDLPVGIANSGIKILMKKKFFLPSGGSMTYQIRDPKQHWFDSTEIIQSGNNVAPIYRAGLTQLLYFVAKPVVGTAPSNGTHLFTIGCTRSYKYKLSSPVITQGRYN